MHRNQFLSPNHTKRNGEKDIFSNSALFTDLSAKTTTPTAAMSMTSHQFSDSLARYSSRKPSDIFSPSTAEKRAAFAEPSSASLSARKGRPPTSSLVLDEASGRRGGPLLDLPSRLQPPRAQEEGGEHSALGTPYRSQALSRSPLLELQLALPLQRLEALWACWVVVYGLEPHYSLSSLLAEFQQFGNVQNHHAGPGNWLFLRFDSPVQAERAGGSKLLYLSPTVLLGVQVMNSQLAKQMNVSLSSDGLVVQGLHNEQGGEFFSPGGVRERKKTVKIALDSTGEREEQESLYIRPRRRKNVCERLLDYFWST